MADDYEVKKAQIAALQAQTRVYESLAKLIEAITPLAASVVAGAITEATDPVRQRYRRRQSAFESPWSESISESPSPS